MFALKSQCRCCTPALAAVVPYRAGAFLIDVQVVQERFFVVVVVSFWLLID